MNETQTTLSPLRSVSRGREALVFYKEAFNARELFAIADEGGGVVAELVIGESRFWVADESPEHANFSPKSLGGGTVRMILTVADPDTLFDQAIRAGGRVVFTVEDQHYGWRVGRLVDPFGHHWEIGRPLHPEPLHPEPLHPEP